MARIGVVHVAVFLIGFCGTVAQVAALREMVVTFYGNELCIGAMLGTWLFWTGLGSLGLGRLVQKRGHSTFMQKRGHSTFSGEKLNVPFSAAGAWLLGALAVMALLLVATVAGARCLKLILRAAEGASLGQIRPFGTMLASALALLGPLCLVVGFLFPLACRAAADAGGSVGTVYLLEAAGAAVGGACYTFALVHWLDPLALAFVLAAACWCVAAGAAGMEAPRRGRRGILLGLGGASLGGAAAVLYAGGVPGLILRIDDAYWSPLIAVRTADSRYGRVTVTAQKWTSQQRTFYVNGTLAFSYPDPPVAEAIAHLPLLEHPEPRRVLLLGGSLGGALDEVLKHPSVRHVTCVELDGALVDAVRRTLPRAAWQALEDRRRVELVIGDGRAFLKRAAGRFDVIIAAESPPTTAQANRFYTLEFFREAARALEPGGVFAFRASGWHDYLGDDTRRLLASLRGTLAAAFPAVLIFPGAECTFLASNREGVLTYRLGVLAERMASRDLRLSHVDLTTWEDELLRLGELEAALKAEEGVALNRDLSPRCYYYEAQRWSAQQRARQAGAGPSALDLGRVLEYLDRRPAVAPLALLGLVAALALASAWLAGQRRPAHRRWRDGALAFSVASTGLIQMGVEFAVLLGFQVVCGYVYLYVGVLVASFMLGLAAGAWVSGRWVRLGRASWRRMQGVQLCIGAFPLVLLGFLGLSASGGMAAWPGLAGVLFSLAALLAGLVGGLQFPLAVALHSAGAGAAGALYGLDLFGSCLGALAVSSVLVPSFGLGGVSLMLAGLGGLGLAGLLAAGLAGRGVGGLKQGAN